MVNMLNLPNLRQHLTTLLGLLLAMSCSFAIFATGSPVVVFGGTPKNENAGLFEIREYYWHLTLGRAHLPLCGLVQPSITPGETQEQNPDGNHDRLARFSSSSVRQTSVRSSGMRHLGSEVGFFGFREEKLGTQWT